MDEKELMMKWAEMTPSQKVEWNGYEGFKNNQRLKLYSLYMPARYRKRNNIDAENK